ncbi:alpha/beta hydrolase [Candidatus Saccharibacteria bacterium]|nr:alpha/beta hydrolase [Candidatus Saccharibacteria bacterium]
MKVVIIHGTNGDPKEGWFPWLKHELEAKGHEVLVPQFPTPEGQNIESWNKVLRKSMPEFDENTILIGHSTGAAYLLSVLESLKQPVRQAILVGGYIRTIGDPQYDEWNKPFYDKKFDWEKIHRGAKQFFVLHGDNDPYVPIEQAQEIARNLHVDLDIIKNGGHLNAESGYTEFPLILDIIRRAE